MKKLFFSFLIILIAISLFGQDPDDEDIFGQNSMEENSALVNENFPKIYAVIKNEAALIWPDDRANRENMIQDQCFAFSEYILLVLADKSVIKRDILTSILNDVTRKNCKNFIRNKFCDKITDKIEKLDCTLSSMVVDWVCTMYDVNSRITDYDTSLK
jgi:hypothetical protein